MSHQSVVDWATASQIEREKMRRLQAVRTLIQELGPDAAIDPLLAALTDDLGAPA